MAVPGWIGSHLAWRMGVGVYEQHNGFWSRIERVQDISLCYATQRLLVHYTYNICIMTVCLTKDQPKRVQGPTPN